MPARHSEKKSSQDTLDEVILEMQKPRMAASTREQSQAFRNAALIVEHDAEQRAVHVHTAAAVVDEA
jgi:hypothetical protein